MTKPDEHWSLVIGYFHAAPCRRGLFSGRGNLEGPTMPAHPAGAVARHVRDLVERQRLDALADSDLLTRYRMGRDDGAFAALVRRHGPMVLGTCRRILNRSHDAEDACQATFLVLARKAGSVRGGP